MAPKSLAEQIAELDDPTPKGEFPSPRDYIIDCFYTERPELTLNFRD